MKRIALTLIFLSLSGLSELISGVEDAVAAQSQSVTNEDSGTSKPAASDDEADKSSPSENSGSVIDAATRRTPPWTSDSANINQKQPRSVPKTEDKKPYVLDDFTVKPEWKKLFADDDSFSTTSGKELYQTMCQACHMADGQGAKGVGVFPSFVGNERLRSPDYSIGVILNGLRGMPSFGDKLSNQQIADVVSFLRTNFGNQLEDDTTGDDVARVRH